jgi:hypothetical protein
MQELILAERQSCPTQASTVSGVCSTSPFSRCVAPAARRFGSVCVLRLYSQFPPFLFYIGTGLRRPDCLKGSIGEAIFSGQRSQAVPDVQGEGKSDLDAVTSPPPAGSKGVGLIKAYQKDPQKFKRYAEMLDIATNAKQVGDVLLRQATLHPPRTSESPLGTPPVNPNIGYFSFPCCPPHCSKPFRSHQIAQTARPAPESPDRPDRPSRACFRLLG